MSKQEGISIEKDAPAASAFWECWLNAVAKVKQAGAPIFRRVALNAPLLR
jgi:hypothetical protein